MSPVDILNWQRRVLADSRLTCGDKLVAIGLSHRINTGTGNCFPSIPCISRDHGISERHVYRVLAALETAGLVSRERHSGKNNVYCLTAPDGHVAPHETAANDSLPLTPMSPPPDTHVRGTPDTHVTQNEQIERANKTRVRAAPSGTARARPAAKPEDGEDASQDTPRGARPISPDWTPDAATQAWIAAQGVSMEDARPAIFEFRAWAWDTQVRRASWDRTFRNNGPVKSALRRVRLDRDRHGGRPLEKAQGPAYRPAAAVLAEIYGTG